MLCKIYSGEIIQLDSEDYTLLFGMTWYLHKAGYAWKDRKSVV